MMEDRNITKNDIEFYLLNREYSELNAEEKSIVDEYVASEQEFNEMKAMIMGATTFFKEEKELEPNPEIKAALLKEFDRKQPAGAYWLNGIFVSLFPKEKKVFQKPGVQLMALAASVLLVVTIAFNGNHDLNNTELAQNDEPVIEEKTIEKSIELENVNEEQKELTNELEQEVVSEFDALAEDGEVEVLGVAAPLSFSDEEAELNDFEEDIATNRFEVSDLDTRSETPTNYYTETLKKEVASVDKVAEAEEESLVISATTAPTVSDVFLYDAATGGSMDDESADLPVISRSLAEDADLIGILYTAM